MTVRAFVTDPESPLVTDSSVVINLIAARIGPQIIAAVPNQLIVPDVVVQELERGRQRGREDAGVLAEWIGSKRVRVHAMGDRGRLVFEQLVVGSAAETLGDGEAATIACCAELGGVALIDERKAASICTSRYPHIQCASSIDLLMHPAVVTALGSTATSDAVFFALQDARMRVWPDRISDVVTFIGAERARLCKSLPGKARP